MKFAILFLALVAVIHLSSAATLREGEFQQHSSNKANYTAIYCQMGRILEFYFELEWNI